MQIKIETLIYAKQSGGWKVRLEALIGFFSYKIVEFSFDSKTVTIENLTSGEFWT